MGKHTSPVFMGVNYGNFYGSKLSDLAKIQRVSGL